MTRFVSVFFVCIQLIVAAALCEDNLTRRSFFVKAPLVTAASFVPIPICIGIERANAYERDVGGKETSAVTTAMNMQAKDTNSRLEKGGFKLDTKEEEQSRLSSALSSFSYDSVSTTTKGREKTQGGKLNKTSQQQSIKK